MAQLSDTIDKVKEFHRIFGLPYHEAPEAALPESVYMLRHRLMAEENDEYLEACKNADLTEIADALGDKLYILCGTIVSHGLQHKIEEVFNEIHRSNLSKLDENDQPLYREDGKIMKSNRYFKPNIRTILDK